MCTNVLPKLLALSISLVSFPVMRLQDNMCDEVCCGACSAKTNHWTLPVVFLSIDVSCHSKVTDLEHKIFSYQDVSGSKVTVHHLKVRGHGK